MSYFRHYNQLREKPYKCVVSYKRDKSIIITIKPRPKKCRCIHGKEKNVCNCNKTQNRLF